MERANSTSQRVNLGSSSDGAWLCGGRPPEGTTLRVYPPQPCGRVPSAHSRGRLALQKPTPQSSMLSLQYFQSYLFPKCFSQSPSIGKWLSSQLYEFLQKYIARYILGLFVVSPTARDQKVIFNILALKQFVCYIF